MGQSLKNLCIVKTRAVRSGPRKISVLPPPKRRFFGTARRWPSGQRPDNNILPPERYKQIAAQVPIEKIMRVPQSPHSLRKVVTTSSDSENDSSSENSSEIKPRPPRVPNFSKKSELRSTTTTASSKTASATKSAGDSTANVNTTTNHRSSRDRTRISAVQRLVERKMAQKEKDREKERDLMFNHRSSSASSVSSSRMVQAATGNGSGSGAEHPNVDKLSLRRSLSRDRLSSDSSANKTYITITSGGSSTRIRESSPSKKDQILNKYCSPLKSTEIFKDLVNDKHSESNNKQDDDQEQDQSEKLVNNIEKNPENNKNDQGSSPPPPQEFIKDQQQKKKTPHEFSERKISFTTEKTILINQQQQPKNINPAAEVLTPEQAKIRKVSIDINYVYEQHYLSNPGAEIIQDEQMVNNLHQTTTSSGGSTGNTTSSSTNNKETSKRRASLEQRIKERSHSASSSMSTSSCGSSSESASSACSSSSSLSSGGSGSSASSSSSSKDSDCCSSLSTPEPIPRQSKQRKISSTTTSASNISSNTTTTNTTTTGFSRNINIILEDEISNENCETSKKTMPPVGSGLKLPKPKTSFHRRFSQDHSTMNVNIKRSSSPPVRKISLQNNSTINTDSLADQKKEEGNQLYLSKNYREALQRYNEAISLCPGCPAFYGNRAACHMMLGQFVQALEDARTSVQLDPHFVKGYVRVAKWCVALGELQGARQAIDTAMSMSKEYSATFDLETTSLEFLEKHDASLRSAFAQSDYRKALYHIEQALKIASASQKLKLSRAECLAFLGRYKEAQEVANDLLRNDSTNIEAIYIRGLCLYYEDNIDKAFTHFQQVLKLAPDHAKAKEAFKRARLLKTKKDEGNEAFKANKFEEAARLYSEALQVDTDNKISNAKLYFNRATVLAKLKKWTQSVEDCNRCLSFDDTYIKAYLRRAKSYMELQKFEEAVRDYERVHKMDRSNFEYRQLLNQAKHELKKSLRKDYYKILGVDRNANEGEIKKAYKKRALEHHPDRHVGATEDEKQEHEKKFKEIGEAYGVLSDAKQKSRYDAGQDLDSNSSGGTSSSYSSSGGFSQPMDAAQMFKAFFGNGNGNAGMHHAFHHHFGFGTGSNNGHNMPGGAFFQFT